MIGCLEFEADFRVGSTFVWLRVDLAMGRMFGVLLHINMEPNLGGPKVDVVGFHWEAFAEEHMQPEKQDDVVFLYTTSLHWSLTQFTPSSIDVVATNVPERVFSILVTVAGQSFRERGITVEGLVKRKGRLLGGVFPPDNVKGPGPDLWWPLLIEWTIARRRRR